MLFNINICLIFVDIKQHKYAAEEADLASQVPKDIREVG